MTTKSIKIGKLLLLLRIAPKGWVKRKGSKSAWRLKAGKNLSQPIGVHVREYDQNVDYSQKTGFVAQLYEFVGRSCSVDVLRKNKKEAIKDCYKFMRQNIGLKHVQFLLAKYCFEQEQINK